VAKGVVVGCSQVGYRRMKERWGEVFRYFLLETIWFGWEREREREWSLL
jgi:hypothetical protein